MSKILEAAKDVRRYIKCKHKWMRLSTGVEKGRIVRQVDYCDKCGTRRTIMDAPKAV